MSPVHTDGLEVQIIPCADVSNEGGETDVCIRVNVPKHSAARRAPVDVVCCIDISGSMGAYAKYEDPKTGKETHDGANMLDIVKHACKAVMFSLNEDDRFSLVTFTGHASLVFPLVNMTDANRELHVADLERQRPDCLTNIWAGIHTSMEALRNPPKKDNEQLRTKTIMLLTDGVPNENPPRGII